MAKYLKPYCEQGYVENSAEIEYLKFNNIRHTVLGFMLGDFNDQGIYTISPDIVGELISMRKYIVDSMDNIDVCLSELKLDKQLTFMVTFEANRATLSLVEKINFEGNFKLNSGSYSNINEYVLDEVETSGTINHNVIYKRWNIGEFGGTVLDISNIDEQLLEKYFGIVKRYKYLLAANIKLLENEEQIEEIEAEYALSILQATKTYPKFYNAVMSNIKASLTEKRGTIRLDKPNFAKTINEVLDDALDEHTSILTEEEKKNFEIDKHNAELRRNQNLGQILDIKQEQITGKIQGNEYIADADKTKSFISVRNEENAPLKDLSEKFKQTRNSVEQADRENSLNTLRGGDRTYKEQLAQKLRKGGVNISQNVDESVAKEAQSTAPQTEPVTHPQESGKQSTSPKSGGRTPEQQGASWATKPPATKKQGTKKNTLARPTNKVKEDNQQRNQSASSSPSRNNYTTYPRRERRTDDQANDQTNDQTGGQAHSGKTTRRRSMIGGMVDDIVDYSHLGVGENTVEQINKDLLNERNAQSADVKVQPQGREDLGTADSNSI